MKSLLDTIDNPKDLKKIPVQDFPMLAQEIRRCIAQNAYVKKGHVLSSFGVVELSIALHYIFNTPEDLLVWDVGHQSYAHKILTGRKKSFKNIRTYGGISGFPKRDESLYDAFGTGHAATSLSAVLGMAMASALQDKKKEHIAVIGDASIVSGMAFEALNHALSVKNIQMLIILNDNGEGIDPTAGAFKKLLDFLHEGTRDQNNKKYPLQEYKVWDEIPLTYTGVVEGHNMQVLVTHLQRLQKTKGVRLLHIKTQKGRGFSENTKQQKEKKTDTTTRYQDVFGLTLLELAKKNKRIVGVTPAMVTSSSLHYLAQEFPDRCFDVGIAESHAVTFSAGMAAQGMVVFCALYSTFLQRAYDQIVHDVCLQNLPVIFCIDRAGLVGEDGATHHGVFDVNFLKNIPNLLIACPMNEIELRNLLYTAVQGLKNPIVIRYPRGKGTLPHWQQPFEKMQIGKALCLQRGTDIAIISAGLFSSRIEKIYQKFSENQKSKITHLHCIFVKPLDEEKIWQCFENHTYIICVEDNTKIGGLGDSIVMLAQQKGYHIPIKILGIPDRFVQHGALRALFKDVGLDNDSLERMLLEHLKKIGV